MRNTVVRGVVPVLATPFDADGSLDLAGLGRLIDFELAAGAAGLATFGLASEAFALSADERRRILATLSAATRGTNVTVIAGVTPTSIATATDQLGPCVEGGAGVIMVMPPHFVKPSASQLVEFFGEIGDEASRHGVDVMIQDAPGATGVVLDPATLSACGGLPGIRSIKVEAPPTAPKIRALAERPELAEVALLGGQNAQFLLEELASGAVGTMPACEFTDLLVPIVDAWNDGRDDDARSMFERLMPLIVWGLQPGLGWAVHKEVLVSRGIIDSATVRAPAARLTAHSTELLADVVRRLELSRVDSATS